MRLKILIIIFALCFLSHNAHSQVLGQELLNGRSELEIDFEYAQGFIIVDLKFNKILPLRFIVDTGAEHIILFQKEIADLMGLEYGKRINLVGSDLEQQVYAYICRSVPLSLPKTPTVLRDIIVLEEDFLHLEELTGESIHGIIGSRFFRGLTLQIDYKKEHLTLHDGSSFMLKDKDKYIEVPIRIDKHKPYLDGKIAQASGELIDLNLLVDTGSALPFLLFLNTHPSLQIPDHYVRGNLGKGLGGDIEGYLGKVDKLQFGPDFEFSSLITSFQNLNPNLDPEVYRHRNGLIGNPILERFELVLDFVHSTMYLKPGKNYDKEFEYDKSGLVIYAFGNDLSNYYIKDVIEGSPAYNAGIRKGDMIKKIGIWPAGFYSLGGILRKLKSKKNRKIKMVLERNSVRYKTSFRLKDYLEKSNP